MLLFACPYWPQARRQLVRRQQDRDKQVKLERDRFRSDREEVALRQQW